MAENLKRRSGVITDGPDRAPSRAMLKAVGFTDEDLRRPIVGVANTWIEIGPCNYHLRRLAAKVKEGIRAAGGTPMEFNTVSISDGISMALMGVTRIDQITPSYVCKATPVAFAHEMSAFCHIPGGQLR